MLGNCFGEDGVELIMETMQAKGHKDEVLGSFSDDEGNSEDEDISHDDDSNHDNEEAPPPLTTNDNNDNEVCTS